MWAARDSRHECRRIVDSVVDRRSCDGRAQKAMQHFTAMLIHLTQWGTILLAVQKVKNRSRKKALKLWTTDKCYLLHFIKIFLAFCAGDVLFNLEKQQKLINETANYWPCPGCWQAAGDLEPQLSHFLAWRHNDVERGRNLTSSMTRWFSVRRVSTACSSSSTSQFYNEYTSAKKITTGVISVASLGEEGADRPGCHQTP